MDVSPAELKDYLCYQTGACASTVGAPATELQAHEAARHLYTMIEKQQDQSWSRPSRGLDGVGPGADPDGAGLRPLRSDRAQDGRAHRLEGFADRAYNVDLSLVSRKLAGSLITDPQRARQAVRMALEGKVKTMDGVAWTSPCRRSAATATPGRPAHRARGAGGARPGRVPVKPRAISAEGLTGLTRRRPAAVDASSLDA